MIDWTKLVLSDSEEDARHKQSSEVESEVSEPNTEEQPDSEQERSEASQPKGRRSMRLSGRRRSGVYKEVMLDLDDSDTQPRRSTRGRTSKIQPTRGASSRRPQRQQRVAESSPEPEIGTRRSERTKARPRRSMREKQEDEISSHEEEKVGPKIIAAKEHFARIPDNDSFRRQHRQDCDTCYYRGDDTNKGPIGLLSRMHQFLPQAMPWFPG